MHTEEILAKQIMSREHCINVPNEHTGSIRRIKSPSEIVFYPVLGAIGTILFFLLSAGGIMVWTVGWAPLAAVGGGVGAIVAAVLGTQGALLAVKLAYSAKTVDVLSILRKEYNLENDQLKRK